MKAPWLSMICCACCWLMQVPPTGDAGVSWDSSQTPASLAHLC